MHNNYYHTKITPHKYISLRLYSNSKQRMPLQHVREFPAGICKIPREITRLIARLNAIIETEVADIKLPELLFRRVLIFNGRLSDKASSGIFNQAWRRKARGRGRTRRGASCRPDAARRLKADGDGKRRRGSQRTMVSEHVDRRCLRIPDGD